MHDTQEEGREKCRRGSCAWHRGAGTHVFCQSSFTTLLMSAILLVWNASSAFSSACAQQGAQGSNASPHATRSGPAEQVHYII